MYPFELHLTVRHDGSESFNDRFRIACAEINVKPLIVELGSVGSDVMTSSRFSGDYQGALMHADELSTQLKLKGMPVIRTKIETVPWHPAAETHEAHQYFESHIGINIHSDVEELQLRKIAAENGCHTSRNAFKVYPNHKVIMVTKRDADCNAPEFTARVDAVSKLLADYDFKVSAPIVEFVIYDSNQAHDDRWVNATSVN